MTTGLSFGDSQHFKRANLGETAKFEQSGEPVTRKIKKHLIPPTEKILTTAQKHEEYIA